jgi:hypothetical protein
LLSNLLEALALVAGDPITLGQVARRAITPDPGAIEVVLDATDLLEDLVSNRQAEQAEANALFWATLGLDNGLPSSWAEGIESAWLPEEVQTALVYRSRCAVRYSLSSLAGLDAVAEFDRGRLYRNYEDDDDPRQAVTRTFDRTICVPRDVGERLRRLDLNLPDSARPLVADHPATGEWIDVLAVPSTTSMPLQAVWLARERSDDEIWYDFVRSIDKAASGISMLTEAAAKKLDQLEWPAEIVDDSRFVARSWFADHAQTAVRALLPQVALSPEDDWLTIFVQTESAGEARLGGPGDASWFTALSSGERALVDEALLDAARALDADWMGTLVAAGMLFGGEPDAGLFDLQIELDERRLDILSDPDRDYWSRQDVDALVQQGRRWWAKPRPLSSPPAGTAKSP